MTTPDGGTRRVQGYCGLCIARCGTVATVEGGRFTRLDPDPTHPTGAAICAKGRAAPELVYSRDRLTKPLRRRNPKSAARPQWEEIGWDEAIAETARAMQRIAAAHGPQAVAFGQSSPSTTAIGDSGPFIRRLMNAFGTPNMVWPLDICGWGRGFATRFAFGHASVATGSGGGAMPDIANAGCLILWGYNPSSSRLTHATATAAALRRGMKLIVVDPRNAGLANKADVWLRVKPGTDGALALGLASVMIERGWYDRDFMRQWTNGPLLVRGDAGPLLRMSDLSATGSSAHFVAWDERLGRPVGFDPAKGAYETSGDPVALTGRHRLEARGGPIACRSVFDHYADLCRRYDPDTVAATCWIEKAQLEEAARLMWEARPVSYYAWSGHEQHANTTDTARALSLLYALTGSFDGPGGNMLLPAVPSAPLTGEDLPAAKGMAPAVGVEQRPLGPARTNSVSTLDFYGAVLDGVPYPVRGLIGFGGNMLLAQSDPVRGREALRALDFYLQTELFMTPSAELADIVLPAASCFEREALKIGFEITTEAQGLVQFRQPILPPPGEARSDTDIVFALARALGLDAQFWGGDVDAAYRHQLGPSGLRLEDLRAAPAGLRVALTARPLKHAERSGDGVAVGFPTPSRKVELWSETLRAKGYAALPDFVAHGAGTAKVGRDAARFPLVVTCAKPTLFCQSQHRSLPALRRHAVDPEVELHPDTAAERGIAAGAWVDVLTPAGGMRARARLNARLDPRVVVGEHGWWQSCAASDAPGYDPFSTAGANFNRTVDPASRDPVSGTPGHRAGVCEVRPAPCGPVALARL
jgi:anaerobic selenocysteine-containing dehydrogenase